jgi:hypothetical protein
MAAEALLLHRDLFQPVELVVWNSEDIRCSPLYLDVGLDNHRLFRRYLSRPTVDEPVSQQCGS